MRGLAGVLVLVLGALVLSACGNDASAQVVGTTGVTVVDGDVVGVATTCDGTVDRLTISGDRTGLEPEEPNPQIGTWKASAPDSDGVVTFDLGLAAAPPDWVMGDPLRLEDGRTYIAIADQADADAEATQVSFTTADLATLGSDEVLVRDADPMTRSDFSASCG